MQVNLMIDDNLLQQAMQMSGGVTTQEIIERALRFFVVQHTPPATITVPAKPKAKRIGALKGHLVIAEDFDDPLPEEIMSAFRGEQP